MILSVVGFWFVITFILGNAFVLTLLYVQIYTQSKFKCKKLVSNLMDKNSLGFIFVISNYVCLESKTLCMHLPVFSIFFFSTASPEYRGIRSKKYFADNHILNTICPFRDSVPVCKMHGCYYRIHEKFEIYSIPIKAMQAITIRR